MKQCFVVCPIGNEESPQRKRSDQVLKHIISPICTELGFEVIRVDQIHDVDKIDDTILRYLRDSELVIADLTDHNPNAFYELGYRHALNKPMIPIIESGSAIPFDLSSIRTISYVTNDLDKVDDVKRKLKETIIALDIQKEMSEDPSEPTSNGSVNTLPYLLNISDSLDELKSLVQVKNDEIIEKIFSMSINKIQEKSNSHEDKALEFLMQTLMTDPSKADALIHMAQKFEEHK